MANVLGRGGKWSLLLPPLRCPGEYTAFSQRLLGWDSSVDFPCSLLGRKGKGRSCWDSVFPISHQVCVQLYLTLCQTLHRIFYPSAVRLMAGESFFVSFLLDFWGKMMSRTRLSHSSEVTWVTDPSFPVMWHRLYLKTRVWLALGLTEVGCTLICWGSFPLLTWFITALSAGANRRASIFLQLCFNVHGTTKDGLD